MLPLRLRSWPLLLLLAVPLHARACIHSITNDLLSRDIQKLYKQKLQSKYIQFLALTVSPWMQRSAAMLRLAMCLGLFWAAAVRGSRPHWQRRLRTEPA